MNVGTINGLKLIAIALISGALMTVGFTNRLSITDQLRRGMVSEPIADELKTGEAIYTRRAALIERFRSDQEFEDETLI